MVCGIKSPKTDVLGGGGNGVVGWIIPASTLALADVAHRPPQR